MLGGMLSNNVFQNAGIYYKLILFQGCLCHFRRVNINIELDFFKKWTQSFCLQWKEAFASHL